MTARQDSSALFPALSAFGLVALAFAAQGFHSAGLLFLGLVVFLPLAQRQRKAADASGLRKSSLIPPAVSTSSDEELLEGPLRWSFLPSTGELRANTHEAVASENNLASLKFLVLHRPTHDAALEASDAYPYSWHFAGRKRTWEVRVQVQFKALPKGKICFGLEMQPSSAGESKSFAVQQVQRLLLSAIRAAIGNDFYHTTGDNPKTTVGEVEPPAFIMPLWAVDQFIVSEAGEEPALSSDLEGLGKRRTSGTRAYIDAMNSMLENLSLDKVYTFCFWGVSPFVDVINWELKGLWPGFRMDAQKLSGEPLVYVVAYDLAESEKRCTRHVPSRKRYFFKVALWSALRPVASLTESLGGGLKKAKSRSEKRKPRPMQRLLRYVQAICSK
mmetsp:Transcript_13625/g.24026  ORF Transcript_13625/g.24026 Transcript_13625/m.24026 type:complete len:387 (+) Transcript_13625:81-1241(+)|eukprot:CAMPEP_0197654674 /NCGR_PEP_ID=MMETSP1338-20131121/38992_1 /TAXON_ID=43686 ORGANISM="Pelagodinium beii, Strain RCC1491" /NCGR_SAMPLE_ID=MMETSP1338 /ASSEMBLY_ACC=CAM_ASM_000754 /LENGTH=386 /DNA_ID=CAMNT_0043230167 /DNA_START=62 /DNA_END=1222 /DNA_ORIENTATION=-